MDSEELNSSASVETKPVKKKRRWGEKLRGAGIVYLVFVLIVWWGHVAELFILHPTVEAIDAGGRGGAVREVVKMAGGEEVELWSARSPGAKDVEPVAYVLFFVGNADRADRWAAVKGTQCGSKPVEVVGALHGAGYWGAKEVSGEGSGALTGLWRHL